MNYKTEQENKKEIEYCLNCMQMTNHSKNVCLKCGHKLSTSPAKREITN